MDAVNALLKTFNCLGRITSDEMKRSPFIWFFPELPEPLRPVGQEIHADVVFAQGHAAGRGGVVTVYPPNGGNICRVALSLPRRLSGHLILIGARADQYMLDHRLAGHSSDCSPHP